MEELYDILLYIGYFLIAVAVISAVVLPLIKSFADPRGLISIGAGIIAIGVIFLIGYALSGGEVLPSYAEYGYIDSTVSKLIGGGLITMYILIGLAILGIAVTELSKLFR